MTAGKLIVIESGTDGSGKTTQFELLYNKLKQKSYDIHKVEFPDYESDSSALVKMYLRGDFGKKPGDVNLYAASTFYAVDRFASFQQKWKDFYINGSIILSDRYTTSNMIHQASKISDVAERESYLDWLRDLEFNKFALPEPDLVVFLNMPPQFSISFLNDRAYKDIHERDIEYLNITYKNALEIAKKYNWLIINCVKEDRVKSIETIHNEIYRYIKKIFKGGFKSWIEKEK